MSADGGDGSEQITLTSEASLGEAEWGGGGVGNVSDSLAYQESFSHEEASFFALLISVA